jgi:hypothetical protein
MLGESDGTVAALDFRLRYDPAVFEPAGTAMGVSAAEAGKQVAANTPYPGEHIVVIMGLNQSVMAAGEVARVAMRNIDVPESGETALDIIDPAMSDPNGVEVAARGEGLIVPLGDAPETPEEPGPKPGNGGTPVTPPARPQPGTPPAPALARGTVGGYMPDEVEGETSKVAPVVTEAELNEARAALARLQESSATSDAAATDADAGSDTAPGAPDTPAATQSGGGVVDPARMDTAALGGPAKTIESKGETAQDALVNLTRTDASAEGRLPWPLVAVIALMLAILGVLAAVRSRLFH